jgi:hypothetical protein
VAVAGGNVEAVRLVLDRKLAPLDEAVPVRPKDAVANYTNLLVFGMGGGSAGGENALMVAVAAGNLDIVKELLDRGIDVRHRDGMGANALAYNRSGNREAITALLRSKGLN